MTNQSDVVSIRKRFSAMLTTVIATLLAVSIFATTAVAATVGSYNVKIVDNGKEITITTNETEPIEILNKANFALATDDKLDITAFQKGQGGTIVINRLNTINVKFDNTVNTYNVYSSTVGDALKEIGVTVGANDEINYSLDHQVEDGMVITVKPAISVSLTVDGKTTKYAIVDGTVSDLLALANVTLGADDYTKPAVTAKLSADMSVSVYRVEYKQETKAQTIKYSTTKINDSTLTTGKTKTVSKGVNGSENVTYKVKYVNGVATQSTEISSVVTKQPVNAVVKVGTKKASTSVASNGVKSKNGYYVGQKISGKYTHYCACSRCCGKSDGITASGKKVYNGMSNPYYIACNWLPLGSVIKVDGVNYTVVDRGGSSLSRKGRIDIFTGNHSKALKLGTGSCSIEIVRLGW